MRSNTYWILAAGLTLSLAGCTTEPEIPAEPVANEATTENPMITEHGPTLSLDESVDAARENLAERLEMSGSDIEVVEARRVVWPNGAMGCPEPDMMYTQALVGGFYIVLEAAGERHTYHAGREGRPFHCPASLSQAPQNDESTY